MKLRIDLCLKCLTVEQQNNYTDNPFVIDWPFDTIPRVGEIIATYIFSEQIPKELMEGVEDDCTQTFVTVQEVAYIIIFNGKDETPIIELKLSE